MLLLNEPCAFLGILVPSVNKIKRDYTYTLPFGDEEGEVTGKNVDTESVEVDSDVLHCSIHIDELRTVCATKKATLNISLEERERIERDTQRQSL